MRTRKALDQIPAAFGSISFPESHLCDKLRFGSSSQASWAAVLALAILAELSSAYSLTASGSLRSITHFDWHRAPWLDQPYNRIE
ncbi:MULTISPECIES: hypothetical protein [Rhodococcus]|uniref:hypothetical protein n=1 Tax=Rhodococcus globerulus TaxID=33008 RepID=UPI001C578F46|nr:hypothetical protein [Rhodococcus globerulus]QXW03018.1 hypothetical protein KYT97_02655 [Rhodococcus globerulus]